MIKIREDRKRGLSGLTSLFISFDYDKNLINVVKSCGTYSFDKNTKEWEVPVSSLSYILDNLTFFDDIELKLMPEANDKDVIKPKLVDQYRTKPFDYQLEGIEFGLNNDKFLLLDAPGLGKSLQIIYLAEELKASKGIEHCLIICGVATLRANWRKEINRHSKLSCMILGAHETKTGNVTWDSVQKRAERLMDKIDEFFIIVNIESLRDDRIIEALQKGPNKIGMIALDEAHRCVSGDTIISTDKGKLKIRDIVEQSIDCKVKSYNIEKNRIEFKSILSRFKVDKTENEIELIIEDDCGNEVKLKCLESHKVFTKNRGWVCAKCLTDDDNIVLENCL